MSTAPANNNPMWIAITVIGGIVAYSMLKKDVVAVADKAADGVKYVADKANPLSQTNILNSVITATGEAVTGGGEGSWSLGTQLNKSFAKDGDYDWRNPTEAKPKAAATPSAPAQTQSYNPRAANYRAKTSTPAPAKKAEAGVPAKQFSGKWLKLVSGKWVALTKNDKVFSVSGKYVVHNWSWQP